MLVARILACFALLGLGGCASVVTIDGQRLKLASAEFRGYVERVFRAQNGVADDLAFADAPGAAAAEERLIEACAGVNELATARRDERRLGLRQSLRAARSVPDCEAATRDAADLLRAPGEP